MNFLMFGISGVDMALFGILLLVAYLAGWFIVNVSTRRLVRAEMDDLRTMIYAHMEREEQFLAAASAKLNGHNNPGKTVVDELSVPVKIPAQKAAVPVVSDAAPAQLPPPAVQELEEITPEVLLVISATVAAVLGVHARIRHARLMQPAGLSPWAQQGRAFVQASHNLGMAQRAHA